MNAHYSALFQYSTIVLHSILSNTNNLHTQFYYRFTCIQLFNIYVLLNLVIYLTTGETVVVVLLLGPCQVINCKLIVTVHTKSELVLPQERTTGLRCIPEGRNVSYQCTVIDASDPLIGSTVWLGNALDCPSSSSQISLQHSQFKSGSRMICGASFASFTEKNITLMEYTSVLNLTAAKELDGKMINCSLSGSLLIGSDTIRVGGKLLHLQCCLAVLLLLV